MCRLCNPSPNEFAPCYASALLGPLEALVEDAETRLTPCFTAWCATHRRIAWVSGPDRALFPCASAHHAHKLALLARLQADFGAPDLY